MTKYADSVIFFNKSRMLIRERICEMSERRLWESTLGRYLPTPYKNV